MKFKNSITIFLKILYFLFVTNQSFQNNEYLKKKIKTGFYLIENLGSVVNIVHKS